MKKGTMKWGVIFVLLVAAICASVVMAGNLEPPPGEPGPTMHTLEDIYRRVAVLQMKQCQWEGLRFCDLQNGTVMDLDSGLVWMRQAKCFGIKNWYDAVNLAANLAHGQCGLLDGSTPGTWSLPTRDEWLTIIDLRFTQPALSNAAGTDQWTEGDIFYGVPVGLIMPDAATYWTSESTPYNAERAYLVGLTNYFPNSYILTAAKSDEYHVWCVRKY